MPKVLFPKNIQKGIFASLSFSIGPFNIGLIQLFILAIGVAGFLGVFQIASNSGVNRIIAAILGAPVLIIFLFIAFFKISELSLIPFLAKYIRTHFFDTTEKFQVDFPRFSKVDILLKKNKHKEKKQTIEKKEREGVGSRLNKMKETGLL